MGDVLTISTAQRMLGALNLLMMLPENHVLFVGSKSCARHSFELGLLKHHERLSFLTLTDRELISGDFEPIIDKAIGEILRKVEHRPKVITLHSGCQMCFLAVDFEGISRNLGKKYGLHIGRFIMNRLLSSASDRVFPELFKSHFSFLQPKSSGDTINLLGSIAYLEPENEIGNCLVQGGIKRTFTLNGLRDFSDFQEMAASRLNIVFHKDYFEAARDMEDRLCIPWIYLPILYDIEKVAEQYRVLGDALGFEIDVAAYRQNTVEKIQRTLDLLRDTPLSFELIGINKPFSMIQALVRMGFNVVGFNHVPYAAYDDEEESSILNWLKSHSKVDTLRNDPVQHRTTFGTELLENRWFEGAYIGFAAINNLMDLIKEAYIGDESIMAETNSILY